MLTDGEKAIQFFDRIDASQKEQCPAVLILDLNLPKKTGVEVLTHLRQSKRCAHMAVAVVSSSDTANDRRIVAELGAKTYIRKPSTFDEFLAIGGAIRNLLKTE